MSPFTAAMDMWWMPPRPKERLSAVLSIAQTKLFYAEDRTQMNNTVPAGQYRPAFKEVNQCP